MHPFDETIISLDDAARHLSAITGKKRNRHVLLRWARRGIAGVRLPTIQIGARGEIYTSKEKLNAFLNDSRDAKRNRHRKATAEGIARSRLADRDLDAQAEELGI